MSDDQELEAFYEDFGAQPLSGSELDATAERQGLRQMSSCVDL